MTYRKYVTYRIFILFKYTHDERKGMDTKISRNDVVSLIASVILCLAVGAISGLTAPTMDIYADLKTPPLSPPGMVFPIVWTILYILMGIALWRMYTNVKDNRYYVMFGLQLLLNFIWTPIYFAWGMMYLALLDLVALWIVVAMMTWLSWMHDEKVSAYLMMPYILWLTFAAYLTFGTIILN